MGSQRKMPAFSSNFLGDEIFRKLKVSADFRGNCPKFRGNCVLSEMIYPLGTRLS